MSVPDGFPQPPTWKVNLNNNIVDGSSMLGGYTSWQLMPNGQKISPVRGSSIGMTVAGSNVLIFYGASGNDWFYPLTGADFSQDEKVTITGPNPDPVSGKATIYMTGTKSTLMPVWKWVGTTQPF